MISSRKNALALMVSTGSCDFGGFHHCGCQALAPIIVATRPASPVRRPGTISFSLLPAPRPERRLLEVHGKSRICE